MTDPVTIGVMAATAGGAIISGIGAQKTGQANAAAYRYKAGVAMLNKQVNEQNAAWATQAGGAKAQVEGMKSREVIASTKVAQSASDFDVNTGSNERVRDSQTQVA